MATTNPIKLFIDRQNRVLVNFNGGVTTLPDFYQANVVDFEISFVDPPASDVTGTYVLVDPSLYPLRTTITDVVNGNGAEVVLAQTTNWVWDAANKKFTGQINLANTNVDTFLAANASKQGVFEVDFVTGTSNRDTRYQNPCNIRAIGDRSNNPVNLPANTYDTAVEAATKYAKRIGLPGEINVLTSPGNIWQLEIGVADDGTVIMNPVKV